MKAVIKETTALGTIIERVASSRNFRFEENSDDGRFCWKLMSGSQIGVEIVAWGEKKSITMTATPMLVFDEYEIFLPSTATIKADIGAISDWVTTAIIGSLERSDQCLEIVNGTVEAFEAAGCKGVIRALPIIVFTNEIQFPFLLTERDPDSGLEFQVEVTAICNEAGFVSKGRSWTLEGGKPKISLMDKEIIRTSDSAKVLASFVKAINEARRLAKKKRPEQTPYEILLNNPRAFGDNVLIFRKSCKSG